MRKTKSAEKKNDVVMPVPENTGKAAGGLSLIFKGYSMLFQELAEKAEMLEKLSISAAVPDEEVTSSETVVTEMPAVEQDAALDDASKKDATEPVTSETAKVSETVDETPEADTVESAAPKPSITADDVIKVVVDKIRENRKNNEAIGAILKTYGVAKVSLIPPEKFEAFIRDVEALGKSEGM
ncbi:MAG TPA: hypothetical protein PLN48_10000 [Lachnospiraceae bacterium]|jgi:hypothetical protein|nr:hypothetical protein [Lachnospiraceae bacterium]